MDEQQNTSGSTRKEPYVIPHVTPPAEVVNNPNPKANENIRVRNSEPQPQNTERTDGVGSEITDGEDA